MTRKGSIFQLRISNHSIEHANLLLHTFIWSVVYIVVSRGILSHVKSLSLIFHGKRDLQSTLIHNFHTQNKEASHDNTNRTLINIPTNPIREGYTLQIGIY